MSLNAIDHMGEKHNCYNVGFHKDKSIYERSRNYIKKIHKDPQPTLL